MSLYNRLKCPGGDGGVKGVSEELMQCDLFAVQWAVLSDTHLLGYHQAMKGCGNFENMHKIC